MLTYRHNKARLPAWFLISILFIIHGSVTLGQEPDLNQRISVHYTNLALETVLNDISQSAHIRFSYSSETIPVKYNITCRHENKALKNVLKDIFQQAGVQYSIVSGYLVLKPATAEQTADIIGKTPSFTVSGIVADSMNNEIMIGATVYVKETGMGVTTNNYGFFSLTLPQGVYTLQTSYLGYDAQAKSLELKSDINWNIHLKQVPFTIKEIIINSVNKEELVFNALAAQTNVDPAIVQRQSAALGETDMLKSLDNIPGISFQSEGSSYFSVRGGRYDQNLILLDEAPIYNPSHLLGLFTPIIPEAIKHTEIYRADFPVEYGGRLSSVIDIRARDGNMRRFSGSASISPVSTRFSVEGPFRKDVSSYFVSFRISTFGLLVKAANPTVERFYFTDFTSKFNFKLGQRDRLYLTLFAGKDAFINKPGVVRNGLEWGNTAATLRWSHIYGSRLFSNTTLYASKYDYSLYTNYDTGLSWNSNVTGTNLKSEFTWYIKPFDKLKFGFNLGGYFFNPGNYSSPDAAFDTMRVSEVNSVEFVFYAGNEIALTKWLLINYGFRFSNWSNYGEAFSIMYDNEYNPASYTEYAKGVRYYSKSFLEPRISISFKIAKFTSLKASYNRNIQHINQINNSISPFNSLEVWLPSGPNIKPQYADIFDLGFVKAWPNRSVDLTADVYYKNMYNQLGYSYHAEMFLNPYLEGELRQGNGYAYGFEIMFKKTLGKFNGQLGYAYTRSFLQIDGLNSNEAYPAHQDKPIDVSIAADYRIRPRWTLNLNMVYTSGMTLTTPTGFYYYRGTQVPVYTKQNNDRLPDYQRVDFGSSWRLNKSNSTFEHYFTFTLYNFFNTRNYAFLNFNKIQGADGKFYVPADKLNMQVQVPTYRFVYAIVPSFTYSLKF
jgi:hypothetical protein